MPEVVKTIEELTKFLNDKGVLEIALRGKNQKFKQFQKVILQDSSQSQIKEQIANALHVLNKNNQLGEQTLQMTNKLAGLSKLNIFINVLNLGVTCAGFALMYKELTDIRGKIDAVLNAIKSNNEIQVNYEFDKILSEHSDMLNKRNIQSDYSEDKMRELVDTEHDVLNLLINAFLKETTDEKEKLIFSIYSLASMLATSIIYYDEMYYFKHKDSIINGKGWHLSHDKWVAVFDKLILPEFISKIQDFGFFELGLNTCENDSYYICLIDQILGLKESINDNQSLLQVFDDELAFRKYNQISNEDARATITQAFNEAGNLMEDPDISNMVNSIFEKIAIA